MLMGVGYIYNGHGRLLEVGHPACSQFITSIIKLKKNTKSCNRNQYFNDPKTS